MTAIKSFGSHNKYDKLYTKVNHLIKYLKLNYHFQISIILKSHNM